MDASECKWMQVDVRAGRRACMWGYVDACVRKWMLVVVSG